MKQWNRVFVIALAVALITFGLSCAAISVDPWTGESDGTVGTKWITVPLALLGLPFLAGVTLKDVVLGHEGHDVAGFVMGGVCHYLSWLLITAAVVRRWPHKSTQDQAKPT